MLPVLLLGAFRAVVDQAHAELARRGHPDARPLHGFALQAVGPEGASISEIGRRLGVSKQAAAKTVASLERLGYTVREPHPTDARATLVRRSPRGEEFLALSAAEFGRVRDQIAGVLGPDEVARLEDDLERLLQDAPDQRLADLPGWLA